MKINSMILALFPVLIPHLYYWMAGRVVAKILDSRFGKLGVISCISAGLECRASYRSVQRQQQLSWSTCRL